MKLSSSRLQKLYVRTVVVIGASLLLLNVLLQVLHVHSALAELAILAAFVGGALLTGRSFRRRDDAELNLNLSAHGIVPAPQMDKIPDDRDG